MAIRPQPRCIPKTLDKDIILSTSRQTTNRHFNFTDKTREKVSNRLKRPRYKECLSLLEPILFGIDNSNKPRSSQFSYIDRFGESCIEELSSYFENYEGSIYFGTIVSDHWNQNDTDPKFYVKKCRDQVRSYLSRNLPGASVIAFVEFQYIENSTNRICMHVHLLLYGVHLNEYRISKMKRANNKFWSSITKHPVDLERIQKTDNDKLRVFSYLVKLPTKKGVWRGKNEALKYSKRPISFEQQMRLLEILSYIPIQERVFAIGDGCMVRKRLFAKLTELRRNLADPEVKFTEEYLKDTWEQFWHATAVNNFQPPKIHF